MGVSIRVYIERKEFEDKLKKLDSYYELESLLYFLLLLDNLLQGKSFYIVENYSSGDYSNIKISNYQEFEGFVLHYFNTMYYDEIIEFEENLKSDIAKDLFGCLYKEWQEKMLLFILNHSLSEEYFIPFSIMPDQIDFEEIKRRSDKKELIRLDLAIREVVFKLNKKYKEEQLDN